MEILDVLRIRKNEPFQLIFDTDRDFTIAPTVKANHYWEPLETLVLSKILEKGNIVLDVGANIGYYSVLFSKIVGAQGQVFSFEPEPNNYKLLKANLLINDCFNVFPQSTAVSDKIGESDLFLAEGNLGDHRLFNTQGRASCSVSTITLDFLFSDTHIDFIKLDTQGWEFNIIKGMELLIKNNRPNLSCLMEFGPGLMVCSEVTFDELFTKLKSLDARLYRPVPENLMVVTHEDGSQSIDSDSISLESLDYNSLKVMYDFLLAKGEGYYEDIIVSFSDIAEKNLIKKFVVRPFSGKIYY